MNYPFSIAILVLKNSKGYVIKEADNPAKIPLLKSPIFLCYVFDFYKI